MGGLPTDDFCQVCRPRHCLEDERLPIGELAMEGQRYPCPFHSPLIQRTLNVEEMVYRPWHLEVNRAGFSH